MTKNQKNPKKIPKPKVSTKKPIKVVTTKSKVIKNPTTAKKAKAFNVASECSTKKPKKKIPTKKYFSFTKKTAQEVRVPTNMSLRSLSKSNAMHSDLNEYIRRSVYLTAYISAVCFVLVGAFSIFSNVSNVAISESEIRATVFQSIPLEEQNDLHLIDGDTAITNSEETTFAFSFLSKIQSDIQQDLNVIFTTSNTRSIEAKLFNTGRSGSLKLEVTNLSNDKYKVVVPAKTLENGYYELRVYLQDFSKKTRIETTEEFFLGGKKAENTYNFGSAVLDKNVEENATSNTTGTPSESSREIETTNKEMLDEAAKDLVVSPGKVASTKFSLVDVKSVLADSVTLQVNTHGNYQFVELYARPLNSLEYRFVSLAKNRLGSWFFNFDSNNLPNGKYELIAKTKLGDEGFETEAIEVLVNNVKPNLVNPKPVSKISVQEQSATPKREFIKLEDIDDKTEDIQLIQNEADFLISLNAEKLNEGLKRYSTALQTGDSILINQAVENLKYFRLDLVETTITNEKLANRSDNINFELQQKIENLKSRAEEFENLRREKSGGETAKDSDKDGVSDVDEVSVYGTDPLSPDTDNDGINDGIEIIDGFDPTNASAQAVIVFESPKESIGLERSDSLVIESVMPIVASLDKTRPVKAEIRGRGLPNSFVTIYIFSNPIVVTVKTDSDGSFVYTFDKELDDGVHDVYVAMTNNTGSIIAQSSPFSFTKRAEAFTFGEESVSASVGPKDYVTASNNTYNLVIGFAVLTLGIILLMLGSGLRNRGRLDDTEENMESIFP